MEKIKYTKKCIALLIFVILFTMLPWSMIFAEAEFDANVREADQRNEDPDYTVLKQEAETEPDTENVDPASVVNEANTEESTTFDLGNHEKMTIMYGSDVRFKDDKGDLIDYDPEFIAVTGNETMLGSDLTGYAYENKISDHKEYIPEEISEETPIRMEYDGIYIAMTPLTRGGVERVSLGEETVVNAYEEPEEKSVKATYKDRDNSIRYSYTSQNDGLKEEVVIPEQPENNKISFKFVTEGLEPVKTETGEIVLKDIETGEERADISRPFMNDATDDAYSEDIRMDIEKDEST